MGSGPTIERGTIKALVPPKISRSSSKINFEKAVGSVYNLFKTPMQLAEESVGPLLLVFLSARAVPLMFEQVEVALLFCCQWSAKSSILV